MNIHFFNEIHVIQKEETHFEIWCRGIGMTFRLCPKNCIEGKLNC